MDLKVQNHPKADSSNTCTIHSNLSLHKLRGCLRTSKCFIHVSFNIQRLGDAPTHGSTHGPLLPLNRRSTVLHLPAILAMSMASDELGIVVYPRWERTHIPPSKKKKTHFFEWMIFYKIRVRICWMLVSWTVYFLLIVDCFHQSCQLQKKCSTFTNLYSMWMKFEGFASPSPPLHSKLIKWIWQHQYISIWFVNDLFCWWVSLPPQGISWVQDCRHWIQLRVLPGSRRHLGPRVPAPGIGQVFWEVEEFQSTHLVETHLFWPRWDTKNPSNMGSFTQNGIFGRTWCENLSSPRLLSSPAIRGLAMEWPGVSKSWVQLHMLLLCTLED